MEQPVGIFNLRCISTFVIARNEEPGSTLPYPLRIPLEDGIILKAKDAWRRTGKVYCHGVEEWPDAAEIIERVPVRSCVRHPDLVAVPDGTERGAAIDLVLDRGRENRSQTIITNARGRQMLFWQTARTSKQARPALSLPGARASGLADLEIAVDIRERYPFTFADRQATTRRERLKVGDYGLLVDRLLQATGERKSLAGLVVRSLGATRVIDYTREDLDDGTRYDVVLDLAGLRPIRQLRRLLTDTGTLVIIGGEGGDRWLGGTHRQLAALALSPLVSQRLTALLSKENSDGLHTLAQLVDQGRVRPALERTYALREAAKAIDHVATGHARGKVALTL